MYTVKTRELFYDSATRDPQFFCFEREFGDTDSAVTFVERFRERAEPGERASAYKRIDDTDYRMPC